jgi:hypothetical protein
MSHVFEHLFQPTHFLAQCQKQAVSDILISIPDMSDTPIHIEHTFHLRPSDVARLAWRHGYDVQALLKFDDHSHFMHLKWAPSQPERPLEIFVARERALSITIPMNSFICPAGHMGQAFYYYAKPRELIGFLDNDPQKQGRRVYGTASHVFPFSKLKEYCHSASLPVNVYVFAASYATEIVRQLKFVNPEALIHVITLSDHTKA